MYFVLSYEQTFQKMYIYCILSNVHLLLSGVPEGLPLCHLVFKMHIIPFEVNAQTSPYLNLYADGTRLFISLNQLIKSPP